VSRPIASPCKTLSATTVPAACARLCRPTRICCDERLTTVTSCGCLVSRSASLAVTPMACASLHAPSSSGPTALRSPESRARAAHARARSGSSRCLQSRSRARSVPRQRLPHTRSAARRPSGEARKPWRIMLRRYASRPRMRARWPTWALPGLGRARFPHHLFAQVGDLRVSERHHQDHCSAWLETAANASKGSGFVGHPLPTG
jgi:hypothetical protein